MDQKIIKEYNVFSSPLIDDKQWVAKDEYGSRLPKEIIGIKTIINLRIKDGWIPLGGITYALQPGCAGMIFYQAMLRYESYNYS